MSPIRPGNGSVALVTGASGGIGAACANKLQHAGFQVFGTSPDGAAPHSGAFRILVLDVRDDASVSHSIEQVMTEVGRIDVLVNNAGVAFVGALEETTLEEFRNVMDTNVFGAVRMMRAVLPVMRNQRAGRIVNIGSVVGFLPMAYSAAYCASKHALRGLSESVDHEVRRLGIRVVVIEPGFTRTDILRHSPVAAPMEAYLANRKIAIQRFEQQLLKGEDPSLVARAVVAAATAEHPSTRYLPDGFARLMSVASRILPNRLFHSAIRRYMKLDSHP
jgi:NAD(P)-dependent dehydrogenase (short-subunit alcohol dehydrogenase family)